MSESLATRLAEIKIFSHLNVSNLQDIAPLFALQKFTRNQTLIAHQEATDSVYFILSGSVRATMFSPSGKQVSYQDLAVGEMYGEMAAIDKLPRSTHVISLGEGELLRLSGEDFLSLLAKYPDISRAVMYKMTGVIRFLCERIYEYGTLSVGQRVRAELLRLARLQGSFEGKRVEIGDLPTHEELASRLATHREAITRELGQLEKSGIVLKKRNKFTILDMLALEDMNA